MVLCRNHFCNNDFVLFPYRQFTKTYFEKDAVPSIFKSSKENGTKIDLEAVAYVKKLSESVKYNLILRELVEVLDSNFGHINIMSNYSTSSYYRKEVLPHATKTQVFRTVLFKLLKTHSLYVRIYFVSKKLKLQH